MGIEDPEDEKDMPKSDSSLRNSPELGFSTEGDAWTIGTAEVDSTGDGAVHMPSNMTRDSRSSQSGDTSQPDPYGVAKVYGHGNYNNPELMEWSGNVRQSQCLDLENRASVGLFQVGRLGAGANNSTPSLSMDSGHSETVLSDTNRTCVLSPQGTGKEQNVTGASGQESDLEGWRSVGSDSSFFSEGPPSFPAAYKRPRCQASPISPAQHKTVAQPPPYLMKGSVPELASSQLHKHTTKTVNKKPIRRPMIPPMNQSKGQIIRVDGGNKSAQISNSSAGQTSKSVVEPKPVAPKDECKQNKLANPSTHPPTAKKVQAVPAAGLAAPTNPELLMQTADLMFQSTQIADPPVRSALPVPHLPWPATGTLQQRIPNQLLMANRAVYSTLIHQVPPMQASGTFNRPSAHAVSPQLPPVGIPHTLSFGRGYFLHPFSRQQIPISVVQGQGNLQQTIAQIISPQPSSLGIHNPLSVARGTFHQSSAQHFPTPAAQVRGTLQQPFSTARHARPPSRLAAAGPLASTAPMHYAEWKGPGEVPKPSRENCILCNTDLSCPPEGPFALPADPPPIAVLPCGHGFHDSCLQKITPKDEASNPPCMRCALGET